MPFAYLRASVYWALYLLSFMFPRDRSLWVFIGWRRNKEREIFAENPKYQFLYTKHHAPDIRPIWISKDKTFCNLLVSEGYEAYRLSSLQGIFFSLRAGYTFIGGLLQPENWRYTGGTRIIQLWHSKSLKKTGFNSPYGLGRYDRFLFGNLFKKPFKFVAISTFLSRFVTNDFNIPEKDLLISGIPKHDVLIHPSLGSEIDVDTSLMQILNRIRSLNPRRVILYGPTFRPDGRNPLETLDLEKLNAHLRKTNDHMVISLHPKFSTRDWIPETNLDHISFSQNELDTYPILNEFDLLVTDYSSLSMDFLLMNKPVILYAFDKNSFEEEMGIYEDLWDCMPGPKVYTFEELLHALEEDLSLYEKKTEDARKTLFDFTDGKASERILQTVRSFN
jgi:CDP-glycerol glycerophosphotransferase (TagB/SpsB family)